MDQRPDELRAQIDRTRAALDRDLDRLDAHVSAGKERLLAASQWWVGMGAIAAGVLGTVVFWPRTRRVHVRDVY